MNKAHVQWIKFGNSIPTQRYLQWSRLETAKSGTDEILVMHDKHLLTSNESGSCHSFSDIYMYVSLFIRFVLPLRRAGFRLFGHDLDHGSTRVSTSTASIVCHMAHSFMTLQHGATYKRMNKRTRRQQRPYMPTSRRREEKRRDARFASQPSLVDCCFTNPMAPFSFIIIVSFPARNVLNEPSIVSLLSPLNARVLCLCTLKLITIIHIYNNHNSDNHNKVIRN